jgi:hypothetical protein
MERFISKEVSLLGMELRDKHLIYTSYDPQDMFDLDELVEMLPIKIINLEDTACLSKIILEQDIDKNYSLILNLDPKDERYESEEYVWQYEQSHTKEDRNTVDRLVLRNHVQITNDYVEVERLEDAVVFTYENISALVRFK